MRNVRRLHAFRENHRLGIFAILAVIGAFAIGLFALTHWENQSSTFSTYEELAASGLIERGWVSEYLPRSAIQIDESHNLDTNSAWASFKYKRGDTAMAQQHCRLLHKSDDREKYVCPPFEGQTSILLLRANGSGEFAAHAEY